MPKSKFEDIYRDLKHHVEQGDYLYSELLPSENNLIGIYDCSRNTIRRAIAGLVEDGEDMQEAAIREMYEETGLTFTPKDGGSYCRPFFTTIGMTDESCGTVYGYCSGEPTNAHQEASEEIQVVLADRAECRRILKEENVAIMCAYMLMHFIASEGDPLTFLDK